MSTDVALPRGLSRSPWMAIGVAAVAFTSALEVVYRASWATSTSRVLWIGAFAALVAGLAAHLWCRRQARADLRDGALDVAHMGLFRVGVACVVIGSYTFATWLAATELYALPCVVVALGSGLLLCLALVDRRRLAWAAAARRGELPSLRADERTVEAPAFFAAVPGELTVVRVPEEAFRGDETPLARIPADTKMPAPVKVRTVAPLLLLLSSAAVFATTLSSTTKLGLPEELAPLAVPGVTIARMGSYGHLEAPSALAFWTVSGPGEAYRVVALERIDRSTARLLEGRALFLRLPCRGESRPGLASITCARWASDVLSGSALILSGTSLDGRALTFDGVPTRGAGRQCFAVDLGTAEIRTWPAVSGSCPPAPTK